MTAQVITCGFDPPASEILSEELSVAIAEEAAAQDREPRHLVEGILGAWLPSIRWKRQRDG